VRLSVGMQSGTVQVAKASARRKSDARRARAEDGQGAMPCTGRGPSASYWNITALRSWSRRQPHTPILATPVFLPPHTAPHTLTELLFDRCSSCLSQPTDCLCLPVDPVRNPPDDGPRPKSPPPSSTLTPLPSHHTAHTLASHAPSTPPPLRSGKAASLMSVTIHESQMMPSYGADSSDRLSFAHAQTSSTARESRDAPANGAHQAMNGGTTQQHQSSERPSRDDGYFASIHSSKTKDRLCGSTTHVEMGQLSAADGAREASRDFHVPPVGANSSSNAAPAPSPSPSLSPMPQPDDGTSALHIPNQAQRVSSPPAFNHNTPGPAQHPYRLQQRHTLEVPKVQTSRAREPQQNNTEDVVSASGRFSPTTPHRRRGSMSLVRRTTRSIHSDMPPEEVQQDDEAARWAEHIRQKRASKRKRKEDEDEDRVVVGTKVDQNHVNWVTAYNMLTGIRFTVSRTNAKMDRELTDADFDAKHKFSFDMYVPSDFPNNMMHLLEFSFTSSGSPLSVSYLDCITLTSFQYRQRAHSLCQVRLQVQGLCPLGLPPSPQHLQARPGRLPRIANQQIHPVRAWLPWQERQLLLFLPRLQVHHQDHPPRRAQVPPQNPQGLLQPRPREPKHSPFPVLRPASRQDTLWTQDPFCRHEQPVSSTSRHSSHI